MLLGAILTITAIIGLINGIVKKKGALAIASAIVLICIAAIGVYILKNPY